MLVFWEASHSAATDLDRNVAALDTLALEAMLAKDIAEKGEVIPGATRCQGISFARQQVGVPRAP